MMMMRDVASQAPVALARHGAADWLHNSLGGGSGGGYSNESEHDLAAMVSEFLEIGSSGVPTRHLESWCSSDSDSGFSDLAVLADKIAVYKHTVGQYESDLTSVVHSLILSIESSQLGKPNTCNTSCLRFHLMKLLVSSGYDAALCATKWQSFGKIPGGEHEFITVNAHQNGGWSEEYIIDIDFRSHFEIARAVKSYNAVMDSLPAVYVGTMARLKHFLQTMVEAARWSLKQNSMPLPPWRSLAYLEAKWESPRNRIVTLFRECSSISVADHQHCIGLLEKLKSCIESEIRIEAVLTPVITKNKKQKPKAERWRSLDTIRVANIS